MSVRKPCVQQAIPSFWIVPNSIYRSMAAGAIIVVFVAIVAATTLLPAIVSKAQP